MCPVFSILEMLYETILSDLFRPLESLSLSPYSLRERGIALSAYDPFAT
jgi:hypothetical protein